MDEKFAGVRLYKWRLSLRTDSTAAWEEPQPHLFLCARLLKLVESQGSRRFMLYDGVLEEATEALMVRESRKTRRVKANVPSYGSLPRI